MEQLLMKRIVQEFGQKDVSLWNREDGQVVCLLAFDQKSITHSFVIEHWTEPFEQSFKQLGLFTFIPLEKELLIVYGERPPSDEQIASFLNDYQPWLHMLVELEKKKQLEKSLHLLIDVARVIASSIQSESVLDVIINSAVKAISNADTGFLLLYDKQLDKLLVKSAVGFREEYYRYTRLSPREGISGLVFASGQPMIVNGEEEIEKTMSNMSEANLRYYLDSTTLAEYPYSVVCVPLIYEEEVLGVLTINNFTKDAIFTKKDARLLQALGDHVAVAIFQMRLFRKEREQREELLYMHQALHKEHDRLQKTTDLHHELTNIAAQGKGIPAILAALQKVIPVPLALYDSILSIKATTQDIGSRGLPPSFFDHPSVKLIMHTKKWQHLELEDETLLVVPIFGPDYLLGFVCAWFPENAKRSEWTIMLEYGATVLALEWTKQETIRETRARLKGEVIDQLLSGETDAQIFEQAKHLGLELFDHYAILLSRAHPQLYPHAVTNESDKRLWARELENWLMKGPFSGTVLFYGKYVLTIVTFSDQSEKRERMLHFKKALKELTNRMPNVQTAVGRLYQGLRHCVRSYQDAKTCFKLFQRHPLPQAVLNYTELGAFRFFLEHDRTELELFLQDTIGRLIEEDSESKKEWTNTLVAYVLFDRQLHQVSNQLSIHYNTLYYRINRIQDLLGVTFDEPQDWFNIQLACYIHQFLYGTIKSQVPSLTTEK